MSTVYTAAQSITTAQWNNIVDYVTIEMTKSAMETYRANLERKSKKLEEGEANDYEAVKNIKSSINTPHYDEFSSHLTNWNSTKTNLVDKIQARKDVQGQEINVNSLFEKGNIRDNYWSSERASELSNEVMSCLEIKNQQTVEESVSSYRAPRESGRSTDKQAGRNTEQEKTIGNNLPVLTIAILSSVLTLVVILGLLLLMRKQIRNFIIKSVLSSERINDKIKEESSRHVKSVSSNGNSNARSVLDKYESLEARINGLERRLSNSGVQSSQQTTQPTRHEVKEELDCRKPASKETVFTRKYLGRLSDGIFRRSSESRKDDDYFYMNEATGEFYFDNDSLQKAKARGSVVFENTSEYSGVSISDARSVETIEPGKVEQVDGGEWKVTKKTIIRLK